jgi:LacI family transcriptional regulator
MLTLEKIAALARVSRSTVSRVINNDPNVSPDTRTRVNQVIEEINYHPNIAARRLAGGHTGFIGLVVPMGVSTLFTDPFFSMIVQAVSTACNAKNRSVMLWLAEPEYERRTIHQFLNNHIIDGAIIASMLIDDPLLMAMIEGDLPFMVIGRYPSMTEVSFVDSNNQNAACEMVAHLVSCGAKRIATISGPQNMIAGLDRLEGYKKGLFENGLQVDECLIVEADFTEQGAYLAMQRLLVQKPDAVFVASDTMAMGAMRALKDAGLRIPEDVAITGFDDMPFASTCIPPLTTMRQPIHRMGIVAAQTLMERIDHAYTTHHHIILPSELVIRESCGAVNCVNDLS